MHVPWDLHGAATDAFAPVPHAAASVQSPAWWAHRQGLSGSHPQEEGGEIQAGAGVAWGRRASSSQKVKIVTIRTRIIDHRSV